MRLRSLIILIAVVFIGGCSLLPCNEPMKEVNGECCLDGNNNQICDNYEVGPGDVDCQLPYIYHDGTCCLDSNGNKICDELETSETLESSKPLEVTSTTSISTSTTIPLNATTTSSATSSKMKTTSTTTTLDYYTTTSTMPVCFDSDGGETNTIAGLVTGRDRITREIITVKDFCTTNRTVREFRCEGEIIYKADQLCRTQEVCFEGECCLPAGNQCKSSSDCCGGRCRKKLYFGLCY